MSSAGQALPKNIFDLLEEILLVFPGVQRHRLELFFRKRPAELFERGALFLAELLRCHRLHGKEEIAAASARHIRHAFAPEPENAARLRTFRHLERLRPVERRHVDAAAKRQGREVQGHLAREIVPFAAEERVWRDLDEHVEIARRSVLRSSLTLTADAEPLAVGDTSRNLDRELPLFGRASLTLARGARFRDGTARALAAGARPRDGKKSLLESLLSSALALRTRRRACTRRGAGAVTCVARLEARDIDARLDAFG